MKDPTPPDALGLVAVSLPDIGEWQAFFVRPGYKEHGERVLRDIRDANEQHGATEVRKPPGAHGRDERTVGGLCGTLAQVFEMGYAKPRPEGAFADALMTTMGGAAWALHSVTGERYLLVTERRAPGGRAGLYSSLLRIEAGTVDEARDKIAAEVDHAKRTSKLADRLTGGTPDPTRRS